MSNLYAVYVYSPTTVASDVPIEALQGSSYSATSSVTLQPGVYRTTELPKLLPNGGILGTTYSTDVPTSPQSAGKSTWPDPPTTFTQMPGAPDAQTILNFLMGAAVANDI